jgi:hypothetical protein
VQIALLIAALNNLKLLACDIQNAYLTADCCKQIYITAGPEFGSKAGSVMVVENRHFMASNQAAQHFKHT